MQCPVFVIVRSGSSDRRAQIEQQFERFGLAPVFVDAAAPDGVTDDEKARYDPDLCLEYYGRTVDAEALARWCSHTRLHHRIVAENIPVAVILEADAVVDDAFSSVIEKLLPVMLANPDRLALVRLSTSRRKYVFALTECRGAEAILDDKYAVLRLGKVTSGTHAYAITRQGAERAVQASQSIIPPAESMLFRFWETGMIPFTVFPFVVHPRPNSVVRPRPRIAPNTGKTSDNRAVKATRPRKSWRQRLRRMGESIRKRLWLLTHR